MPFPARLILSLLFLVASHSLVAQLPLVRIAATSLQLPANPPPTTYATTPAFPGLSFNQPVALVTPGGETRRLFVVEKTGRIWVVPDVAVANPTRSLFLDLTGRVAGSTTANDERGLLALAFHPQHATNGEFFVWYTVQATTSAGTGLHNRLSRFRVTANNANVADPNSESPLLTQRDEANNHNGGELLFGPDGYLYLSLGDEGGANDQFRNSQRIDRDFFAGIIRLDVDRRPGSLTPNSHPAVHAGTYTVPSDNPFVGATSFNGLTVSPSAVRTEFWATGLRNPWRMAFDSATGQLWCADVGQGSREEINLIVRGGNYGWDYREGFASGPRSPAPAGVVFVDPVWDYARNEGQSVTGGFVYRGPRHPGLHGRYLFADFSSGRLWALDPDGSARVPANRIQLLTTDTGIASFGLDPSTGDILLADLLENTIKRLVATPSGSATPFPPTLSATGAFTDVVSLTPAPGLVAYTPNVSFWSDHATKRRWFALRDHTSTFGFERDLPWSFPSGAVWVKHFDLEHVRGDPASSRRIETRFLVKTTTGSYGITYRWNEAQTDAVLVPDEGAEQTLNVSENGGLRSQTWRFPSRAECLTCHTAAGGHALSFNTRQLNRTDRFPGGSASIIEALAAAGYLAGAPASSADLPSLAAANDPTRTIEARARSYLDANCVQCHQPGGTALGNWDARSTIPLTLAGIINGPLVSGNADPVARVVVPGDPARSGLLNRIAHRGGGQMPPVGSTERDLASEALLREWIETLATHSPVPQPPSRIVNLAARAQAGRDANALITGFVIAGEGDKTVLIRGVGPTLGGAPFNVSGSLADPILTLFGPNSSTRIAAVNDNWLAADAATFHAVGAFSLPPNSRDAAIVVTLAPGAYTAQLAGSDAISGVALVEVYDADSVLNSGRARLVNTSVRAHVGTGANILIPGLVVGAGAHKTVLIRAVGPRLGATPFDVAGVLAEPVITLYLGAQRVAINAGWSSAANASEIRDAAGRVGAFPLPENSRDSALLVTLPAGAYTIQVAGANGTAGVALVEIYEVR
jgi:uncharacterized repeat protein (TIGR03806 family)